MIGNVSQEETAAFGAEAAATFGVAATAPGGWREYRARPRPPAAVRESPLQLDFQGR